MSRVLAPTLALTLALAVAGCGYLPFGKRDASPLTVPNVARETTVSPMRAAELINAHRKGRGREPVVVDPALNSIAADTAKKLARRDKLKTRMHTAAGLGRRLNAARYGAERAVENLGSGYPTLARAVDGWKSSKGHNANLLNKDMTHMGIALALTDKGVYHSYWVLIMARPDSAPSGS